MIALPRIVRVPIERQRFTTLGDWWEENPGEFVIAITEMVDWRYEFLILVHELIEWAVCQQRGVSTRKADEFDEMWEQELAEGKHRVEDEAGFDRRCPYRMGHIWGCRAEWLLAGLLKVRWHDYCQECNDVLIMGSRA